MIHDRIHENLEDLVESITKNRHLDDSAIKILQEEILTLENVVKTKTDEYFQGNDFQVTTIF